jgi:hypothetical protein
MMTPVHTTARGCRCRARRQVWLAPNDGAPVASPRDRGTGSSSPCPGLRHRYPAGSDAPAPSSKPKTSSEVWALRFDSSRISGSWARRARWSSSTSPAWASYIEAGQNLTLRTMVGIAAMLGVKIIDLLAPPESREVKRGRPRKAR